MRDSIGAGFAGAMFFIISISIYAQQPPPPKVVQVAEVTMATIAPTVSVPGTIYSRNAAQITAGVAGQLEMVAEPGTYVGRGDIVASIDRSTLLLQRAEQEALLARAAISVRQLESDLSRLSGLRDSNLVSEFDLEQTQANRDLAKSDANITQVRIRQIDDQIRRTTALAAFAGIVVERMHRAGEYVATGEVLARITDIDNMEVRAFVPLKHLSRTVVGGRITIFERDNRSEGVVRALIPTGDVRSQTFEARIDLPKSATAAWAIGQLVSVSVPIRAGKESLSVPRDALVLRQNGQFVYRINDDNRAERIYVEIGDTHGNLIAVSGALQEGDTVAIRGAEGLTEGAEVQVMLSVAASSKDGINDG